MPCHSDHRPIRLRPHVVLIELAVFVLLLAFLGLSQASASISLLGLIMVLLNTILFYRLGRISERVRAQPSIRFVRELGWTLAEKPD